MAWRKFSIQFRNFPLSSSFYLFLVKANYIFSHCIFLFCVSPQLHIFQNSSFCVCWNYGSAKILFWSLIWVLRVILYQLWVERGQQLITFWPTFLSKNQLSTNHKNHVGLRKKNFLPFMRPLFNSHSLPFGVTRWSSTCEMNRESDKWTFQINISINLQIVTWILSAYLLNSTFRSKANGIHSGILMEKGKKWKWKTEEILN